MSLSRCFVDGQPSPLEVDAAYPKTTRLTLSDSGVGENANEGPSVADDSVPYGLRIASGYAWRLIVIAVAVYLIVVLIAQLTFVAVAVFAALVISAWLRPLVDRVAVALPAAWPLSQCCY